MPDSTGPHAIPPPPLVPRDPFAAPPPESDPPISAKGASWKTIAAAVSVIAGIVASTVTLSYQIGERAAEQRARDAEQSGQLEIIDRRIDRIGEAQLEQGDEITAHRERLTQLRHDVDTNTSEIRDLNKRRGGRTVHD